jgi:hypothetical protein
VWLTTGEILGRAGKVKAQQVEQYRADVRERLSMGVDPGKTEELRDAFALGSETFRAHVRKMARHGREAVEPQRLARWLTWPEILDRVALVMGVGRADSGFRINTSPSVLEERRISGHSF